MVQLALPSDVPDRSAAMKLPASTSPAFLVEDFHLPTPHNSPRMQGKHPQEDSLHAKNALLSSMHDECTPLPSPTSAYPSTIQRQVAEVLGERSMPQGNYCLVRWKNSEFMFHTYVPLKLTYFLAGYPTKIMASLGS